MLTDLLITAGWAWLGIALLLTATFLAGRAWRNYAIVDAVWTFLFTPVVLWYAAASVAPVGRRVLLVAMVSLWSVRLGSHLAARIARMHPEEDKRYRVLRERWGAAVGSQMFGFYQLQGAMALVLSLPFLLLLANPAPFPGVWELAGAALFIAAVAGEAVADAQLHRSLQRDPRGVCTTGLWRYSRHPNYFFEWLIWVAWALCALPAPGGWLGLAAPALMLHLLLNVTGVPAAEASSLASRGEAYRRYQDTTPAFFPGLPRRRAPNP